MVCVGSDKKEEQKDVALSFSRICITFLTGSQFTSYGFRASRAGLTTGKQNTEVMPQSNAKRLKVNNTYRLYSQ